MATGLGGGEWWWLQVECGWPPKSFPNPHAIGSFLLTRTPKLLRHRRCGKEYMQQNGHGTNTASHSHAAWGANRAASSSSGLGIVKALRLSRPRSLPWSTFPHLQRTQATEALRAGPERASCLIARRSGGLAHPRPLDTDRTYKTVTGNIQRVWQVCLSYKLQVQIYRFFLKGLNQPALT